MFHKSARFYDLIYGFKDYEKESAQIHALIQQHKRSEGNTLLDVACGTGAHIAFLNQQYVIEGLDLDDEMLNIARERFPNLTFHLADMCDFDLGRQFDIVTCLFSSIGYVGTVPRLNQAVACMEQHLLPGGVLILEPWIKPEFFTPGGVHARFVDEPDLKIARMNDSEVEGSLSILNFHYLVSTPEGVQYFTERHELGLFTHEQYLDAFSAAKLTVIHDWPGLMNRGLYIGLKGD